MVQINTILACVAFLYMFMKVFVYDLLKRSYRQCHEYMRCRKPRAKKPHVLAELHIVHAHEESSILTPACANISRMWRRVHPFYAQISEKDTFLRDLDGLDHENDTST